MDNRGIILEQPKPQDYILGGGKLDNKIIKKDGQWDNDLPVKEYQHIGFETMACVSFSALNCLEIYFKTVYNYEINFSDRFLAKMSGTNINGNYISNVANSLRRDGAIYESDYPMVNTWKEYYKNVPFKLKMEGQKWLREFEVNHEWVITNLDQPIKEKQKLMMESLMYAPLQVIVWAWKKKGEYYVNNGRAFNHAVTCYGYVKGKYWKIYDHYDNTYKKLAWDYNFASAKKYTVKKKGNLYQTNYDGSIDGFPFHKKVWLTSKEFWRALFTR